MLQTKVSASDHCARAASCRPRATRLWDRRSDRASGASHPVPCRARQPWCRASPSPPAPNEAWPVSWYKDARHCDRGPRRRQPGDRSLADQLALKFSQCGENAGHEAAAFFFVFMLAPWPVSTRKPTLRSMYLWHEVAAQTVAENPARLITIARHFRGSTLTVVRRTPLRTARKGEHSVHHRCESASPLESPDISFGQSRQWMQA